MDEGDHYDDYAGHGVDEEESIQDSIAPNFGGLQTKIRNAEGSPIINSKGVAGKGKGGEGNLLAAGEKNVQSDKDENSEKGANWANRTGEKAKMVAMGAVTGGLQAHSSLKKLHRATGIKVATPIATVIIILCMCIGGFMGGASTMLASFMGNVTNSLDVVDVAVGVRSQQIITSIMLGKNTRGGAWGNFSSHMKKMFQKAGITVETNSDGVDTLKVKNDKGEIETIDGSNYNQRRAEDVTINTVTTDATATVNNSTVINQGSTGSAAREQLGVKSLNTNADIKQGKDDEETTKNFNDDAKAELEEATASKMGVEIEGGQKGETEEVDGNTGETRTVEELQTGKTSYEISKNSDVAEEVTEMVTKEANNAHEFDASIIGSVANGMCTVYNTAMSINRMVKAYEKLQVIRMGLKVFEAIQRMQVGDGGADDIVNVVANYMTHTKTTSFELEKGSFTDVTSSAINGAPVAALFGGNKITSEDPIVRSFVTSPNEFRKIADSVDPGSGYKVCTGTKIAAGILDAGLDAASLGTKKILDLIVGVAISGIIAGVIAAFTSFLVPKIVNALKRDFTNFLEGPEGSGTLEWAAEAVNMQMAKYIGESVGTEQSATTYFQKKSELVANRARYDRANLSPFDTSSQYTFLGTLMGYFNKATVSMNSVIGNLGQITSVVNQSLIALTPASHAADAIDNIMTSGDNAEISSLVNDGQKRLSTAFGEPYYIPSFASMGENVEDVMWYWDAKGAFSEPYDPIDNPNPPIQKDGFGIASAKNPIILAIKEGRMDDIALANYTDNYGNLTEDFILTSGSDSKQNALSLCVEEKIERGAELGVVDPNIEQKYSAGSTGSGFWDTVLGIIPVIGGFLDAITGIDNAIHMNNILGGKYHEDTKENHMCEMYSTDQGIGEGMGVYDQSQITQYIEDYRKDHPLDNSTLGIVARWSGLTKDQALTAINRFKTMMFIANYDPAELGPIIFTEPKVELSFGNSDNSAYIIGIIINTSFIEEKRNQNITA